MTIINGVNLHYEVIGVGEPLLLVHGSWGDHREYEQIVPALAERFRVVSYDRRGHSASGPATGSAQDDVTDAAALIEHLSLEPTHVFGACSFVPLWLAARRPDLLRTAGVHEPPLFGILSDGAPPPPAAEAQALDLISAGQHTAAARTFFEQVVMGPEAWAALPAPIQDTFVANAPTFLEERDDPDTASIDLDALRSGGVPTWITTGQHGDPAFRAVAQYLHSNAPGITLAELPGGHAPHITHPADFVAALTTWLTEHSATETDSPTQRQPLLS